MFSSVLRVFAVVMVLKVIFRARVVKRSRQVRDQKIRMSFIAGNTSTTCARGDV